MMIDQSMGLKFRTFELMYSILSPAFMGSAVSAHGWSCNSPLLTTSCFFCLVHCFNPNSGPPKLSGELRADTPNAHEPRRWFHNDTWKKKRPRLFLLVKLQNWPMAAKELQPPATNLPRFITEHCHWNLCCQQHDHMTTWPQKRTKMGESTQVSARPPPLQSMLGHPL